jgi:hypothetical protein
LEKDWEARFGDRRANRPRLSKLIRTRPAKIAAGYWLVVSLLFFVMEFADFDMGAGVPVAVLTVPWSLLATAFGMSHPSATQPFVSPAGNFAIFVVLCGGLNAILIFVLFSALQRRRKSPQTGRG